MPEKAQERTVRLQRQSFSDLPTGTHKAGRPALLDATRLSDSEVRNQPNLYMGVQPKTMATASALRSPASIRADREAAGIAGQLETATRVELR
jgi:hypothetical protein